MAEVKNSFLGSKMNQDLDDRLIPNNEYREGLNISVSNSEGNSVGAIETILGNTSIVSGGSGETIIGYFVDEASNTIFLFSTNYTYDASGTAYDFAPNDSVCKIYSYNVLNEELRTLVEGSFLNFETTHLVYGVNLIENLLFWTDNRNQPRKINIKTALGNSSYYSSEDHISVAKYAPFEAIQLYEETDVPGEYRTTMTDAVNPSNPDGTTNIDYNASYAGDKDYLAEKFVRFSYRFKFDDGEYSIMAPFTQIAFIPKQDGSFIDTYDTNDNLISSDEEDTFKSSIVSFMENKVNNIKLIVPLEYPSNQIADKLKVSELEILYSESDSTLVKVVDSIPVDQLTTSNKFYDYDYQGSKPTKVLPNDQTLRVYDKVPVRALSQEVIGNRVVYGNYVDKHSSPSSLNYAVNISEKAESNADHTSRAREEYPEHTLKKNRNYQVAIVLSDRYGRQSGAILSQNPDELVTSEGDQYGNSTVYSPYSKADPIAFAGDSLKVLFNEEIISTRSPLTDSDEFNETGEPGLYVEPGINSVKILSVQSIGSGYTSGTYDAYIDPITLPGRSGLKVTISVGANGSISGAAVADPGTGFEVGDTVGLVGAGGIGGALGVTKLEESNPLGWYSYKIVVKQTEQEYYNVYVPDIVKGSLTSASDLERNTSYISLINDNINKVPRELEGVGPQQKSFGSNVELFPIVDTPGAAGTNYNVMFDASASGTYASSISTLNDLLGTTTGSGAVLNDEANPLIAKIITPYDIGRLYHTNTNFNLGVLETAPFESLLDIYWETSTTGLISEINKAVRTSNPDEPSYIINWDFDLSEGDAAGDVSVQNFEPRTSNGQSFNSSVTLTSVIDGMGNNRSSDFTLTGDSTIGYNIQTTNNLFYFGTDASTRESYSFSLSVTNTDHPGIEAKSITLTGSLANTLPTVSIAYPPTNTYVGMPNPLTTVSGVNGAVAPYNKLGLDLNFSNGEKTITSYTEGENGRATFKLYKVYDGGYYLTYDYDSSNPPYREITLNMILTDAGGATDSIDLVIDFVRGDFNISQFTKEFNI